MRGQYRGQNYELLVMKVNSGGFHCGKARNEGVLKRSDWLPRSSENGVRHVVFFSLVLKGSKVNHRHVVSCS